MKQKVLEILAEVVGFEDVQVIHLEDNLSDLGLTSILFIQFIVKLEDAFSIEILDSDLTLKKFETVEIMFDTLQKYFEAKTPLKKVLVCDCDNVLWQGVAGEEPLRLTEGTLRFQRMLSDLYKEGVLLCLCSKNEPSNILDAFALPGMILTMEHIVSYRINRRDKAANLQDLAVELNLSVDSFVFVDDSDYELGLVQSLLPEVAVVKADEGQNLLSVVRSLFPLSENTDDRNRTELYREQKQREKEKLNFSSVEEYNSSLNTVVICDFAKEEQLARLAELSRRTNQCNLSVSRYTEADLQRLTEDPTASVFVLSASDKYGDMGIVGGAVLRKTHAAIIESFFVSCRVFDRSMEEILLARLRAEAKDLPLLGILQKTEKNRKYHDFYLRNGVTTCE
ncbi:MAG: HAD-IIIC family phosphatase [Clostridia bacterium]|nr:HAD-IIIC family phosphatase [Clostridia bacterium]